MCDRDKIRTQWTLKFEPLARRAKAINIADNKSEIKILQNIPLWVLGTLVEKGTQYLSNGMVPIYIL